MTREISFGYNVTKETLFRYNVMRETSFRYNVTRETLFRYNMMGKHFPGNFVTHELTRGYHFN